MKEYNNIWNKIRPNGCAEGCGLLCISCIAKRLDEEGFKDVPVWLCGTEPLKAMTGNPGDKDNINILRKWDFKLE